MNHLRTVLVCCLCLVGASAAEAQITSRIGRAVAREAEKQIRGVAVDAVRCGLGDERCAEDAEKNGKQVVYEDADGNVITDENGNPIADPGAAQAQQDRPGEGVWRNYDFVPGDSVWRVIDWSNEPVGRFPQGQVEFIRGNMEIVEKDGVKVLEARANNSTFEVSLPDTLPEAFTVEFLIEIPTPNIGTYVHFDRPAGSLGRYPHHYLYVHGSPGIYHQSDAISNANLAEAIVKKKTPVRVQVNGQYGIVYVGPYRAGMMPNANFARGDRLRFEMNGNPRFPTYISDIVVRVGLSSLYDGLMRDGSITTYAFLFDIDSDRLRGESTPKLEELRSMLAEHDELRIEVIGHTDATGEDAHNLDLSERRAASVVGWLVSNGIAADRLAASGRGEAEPIADNGDAAGRAKNRRVVIRLANEG